MQTPLRFWWHELNTWHPEDALTFYGQTLGWVFEPMRLPDGTAYWTARKWGLPVGGILGLDADHHGDIPSHWMTYMAVDAMDKAIQDTVMAGGSLARAAIPVPGIGLLAVVNDPGGALIGLMEPDKAHVTAHLRSSGRPEARFEARFEARSAISPLAHARVSSGAGPEASPGASLEASPADTSAENPGAPVEETISNDADQPVLDPIRAKAG